MKKTNTDQNNGTNYATWIGLGLVGGGIVKIISAVNKEKDTQKNSPQPKK